VLRWWDGHAWDVATQGRAQQRPGCRRQLQGLSLLAKGLEPVGPLHQIATARWGTLFECFGEPLART